MGAKWTERGIEDSHGHLIADPEGTVVCTKRKQREEIPVGKMILGRSNNTAPPYKEGSVAEKLSKKDSLLKVENRRFKSKTEEIQNQLASAGKLKALMIVRLQRILYEKGLAAPDIETLNSDKRFACPAHPDSRFLWEHLVPYQTNTTAKIFHYRRSCLQCSLPEHFRDVVSLFKVASSVRDAYSCTVCGIVFGTPRTEMSGAYDCVRNYYCILCGNNLGHLVYDLGR